MPLKAFNALGNGDTLDAIKAIEYANAQNVSVISMSWGGSDYSQALKDAIDASPAVVVCAAGNSPNHNNDDTSPVYPASYNSSNIISVAATDRNDLLASFSNIGLDSVDLAAPGASILSTSNDGNYASMDGTSMATPHVSGVAALVKAANSSLTSHEIKMILLSTVDVKDSLTGMVATGGRLNASQAVTAATPSPLNASFTASTTAGTAPLAVLFFDTTTGGPPTDWNWSFKNVTGNNTEVWWSNCPKPRTDI